MFHRSEVNGAEEARVRALLEALFRVSVALGPDSAEVSHWRDRLLDHSEPLALAEAAEPSFISATARAAGADDQMAVSLMADVQRVIELADADAPRPDRLRTLNVPPPAETGLPPGVSPDAIGDPVLRQRYLDDIAANRDRGFLLDRADALDRAAREYAEQAARIAKRLTLAPSPSNRHIALKAPQKDPNASRAVARNFADDLVSRLVRDLDRELEAGWRSPAAEHFRGQLVTSSDVIDTPTMLAALQMSHALMERVCRPSAIRESAMSAVLAIVLERRASLLREIERVEVPDGPDHPDEFRPRPQAGNAIGGSFTEFRSDAERAEFDRNHELLMRRNQFKVLRAGMERALLRDERDVRRLVGLIDSTCDADGKAMLRRMLCEAGTDGTDFLAMWLDDDPASEPGGAVTPARDPTAPTSAAEAVVQEGLQPAGEIMAFNAVLSSIASAASADRPCPEALGVLSASLHSRARDVPPPEVLAALSGHTGFLEASRRPDASGQLLVRLALHIAMEACTRAEQEWQHLDRITPKTLPHMPAFVLRYGGYVTGAQARAAVPPFRNDAERAEFAAWQAEEQAARELRRSHRQAMGRLRLTEGGFRHLARDLYFHADEQGRTAIVSQLAAASGEGVDYLERAGLRRGTTPGED
jgi:hypothetical protein